MLEADGAAMAAPKDFDLAITKSQSKGAILLKVESGNTQRFVALPLKAKTSTPAAPSVATETSTPAAPPTGDDLSNLDTLE